MYSTSEYLSRINLIQLFNKYLNNYKTSILNIFADFIIGYYKNGKANIVRRISLSDNIAIFMHIYVGRLKKDLSKEVCEVKMYYVRPGYYFNGDYNLPITRCLGQVSTPLNDQIRNNVLKDDFEILIPVITNLYNQYKEKYAKGISRANSDKNFANKNMNFRDKDELFGSEEEDDADD